MKYYVEDIRQFKDRQTEVEANSPLEAAQKVFPNHYISRDLTGVGDIVVGRYIDNQQCGRCYRTYVYNIEKRSNKK